MDGLMDGWMDKWINGWINGWWMDGRKDRLIHAWFILSLYFHYYSHSLF
jgi:hypothetical protein